MVWRLIECPQTIKPAFTGFKTFLWYGWTQILSLLWRNYRMKHPIDKAGFHPLQASRITPSQLLPSNPVTNIFFHLLQTYWNQNYSSKHRACRNRRVKAPEGPWMADVGAARPGWRSETPNMQPLTPLKSYLTSRLQSGPMCFWIPPAVLRHTHTHTHIYIYISDWLTLLRSVPSFGCENQLYVF